MEISKATIVVGKEKDTENYQLFMDKHYISTNYKESNGNYTDFINKTATDFAELISEQKCNLKLSILNGFKIDKKEIVRIEKLESKLFEDLLINRLKQLSKGRTAILPIAEIIN